MGSKKGGIAAVVALLAACVAGVAVTAAGGSAPSRIVIAEQEDMRAFGPRGADLGRVGRLAYLPSFTVDLAVSEDGRRIAVLRRDGTNGSHGSYFSVLVADAGGRFRRRFKALIPTGGLSIALSPNRRLIALSGGDRIRLLRADGSSRRLPRVGSFVKDLTFSADGRRIVFSRMSYYPASRPGPRASYDLYSVALSGRRLHQITDDPTADEMQPAVSPGGRHVAYLRQGRGKTREDGYELWAARGDGSKPRFLAAADELSDPDFSPSGSALVFSRRRGTESLNRRYKLFTIRPSGRGLRLLAKGIHPGPPYPQWTRVP